MRITVSRRKPRSESGTLSLVAIVAALLFLAAIIGDTGFSGTLEASPTSAESTLASTARTARPVSGEKTFSAGGDVVISEPLITNVFYESDIREALRDISVQAKIPIVPDQTVHGFVTLEVVNLPLEKTLQRLLAAGGFTFKKMDGYYLVGAPYPDNPSFALLTTTERIRPSYLKAAEVPALMSDFYQPFIKVEKDANILVVSASPEIIDRIKADMAKIDVPPIQVMIEALVTEFSKSAMKKIGVDWRVIGSGPDYALSLVSHLIDTADSTFVLALTRTGQRRGDLTYDLASTIQLLSERGEVRISASPRVATLDGMPASIFLGSEEYYDIVTGPLTYPYSRLEMIKVGITLKIRPFVAENGDITVEIEPEVSDVVGKGATSLPIVTKRSVSTQIRVKDGETIAIGGLKQRIERNRVVKIPLLGDIPLIKYFFSYRTPEVDENDVVVFITPHVMKEEAKK
jgi:type II secretory pathway component GspD/PulD (secretin)